MKRCLSDSALVDYIRQRQSVKLAQICRDLAISESTARRMLARLDEQGDIVRYAGGAHVASPVMERTFFDERKLDRMEAKQRIAHQAVSHIRSDSCIMLLGGTTVACMCSLIRDIPLTIISNSLDVFEELKTNSCSNLILLGGRYNHNERELHGNITNMGLGVMYADMVFLGCSGLNVEHGFTTDDFESVSFYQLCLKNSGASFVLAGCDKIGRTAKAIFAGLDDIDCVITDDGLSEAQRRELVKANIHFEIAQ